jgi:hypothetical protein
LERLEIKAAAGGDDRQSASGDQSCGSREKDTVSEPARSTLRLRECGMPSLARGSSMLNCVFTRSWVSDSPPRDR